MEEIIFGLKNEGWDAFVGYLKGGHWAAAISSASPAQLERAFLELDLDEQRLERVARSYCRRFERSEQGSSAYPADTLGGYSDSLMTKAEFERAAEIVMLGTGSPDDRVRGEFYKALSSSVAARPEWASVMAVQSLTMGLADLPETAVACAKAFEALEEGCPGKYTDVAVEALVKALSFSGDDLAVACASALGAIGQEKGEEPQFRDLALPSLKLKAEALRKGGAAGPAEKLLDAAERIETGRVRGDASYRSYLGDGETLRVPMFSNRPVPADDGRRKKQRR